MTGEGLEQAIAFEREEQQHWADAAATSPDPLAARVFAALAVEEIEHRQRLEYELAALREHGRWERAGTPDSAVEEILHRLLAEAGRSASAAHSPGSARTDTIRAFVDAGRTVKQRCRDLYDALFAQSTDEDERSFFRALREAECQHLTALESLQLYLAEPVSGDGAVGTTRG